MPIAFDHDCREGICGSCAMLVDGVPHGPLKGATVCQLHMRHYKDGDTLVIEPWRAKGFPILRDLVVDRSAFDRIIQAGGYISVSTGRSTDANAVPIAKDVVDQAMDAAQCIGCGACVAACPNASAMLFTAAKATHLGLLPQGTPGTVAAGPGHGASDGRRELRRVHQLRGVPGGVSQGNQRGNDRVVESGLSAATLTERRESRAEGAI